MFDYLQDCAEILVYWLAVYKFINRKGKVLSLAKLNLIGN